MGFLSRFRGKSSETLAKAQMSCRTEGVIWEIRDKEMKDELGLDHFEGRGWRGWNHHVRLVLLAYTFLVLRRRGRRKKGVPSE
jgi:SRSO17 transposase